MKKRRGDRRGPGGVSRTDIRFQDPERGFVTFRSLERLDPRISWLRDTSLVLRDVDDRRRFHPAGPLLRPAVSLRHRSDARSSVKHGLRRMAWHAVGFAVPEFVVTCIRRKQRKEVLHATNFGGGGRGSVSPIRRRNYLSDVFC